MSERVYLNALLKGWSVEPVSLYDEEGVEGWRWTSPEGYEYSTVGDWSDDPSIPDEVFARLK